MHTHTVVLWCVELGGVQSWQSSLSWPRPSRCSGAIRYRRKTAVSTQWSLLTGNVIISAIKNLLLYILCDSYELMLSCWNESPSDRPAFRDLVVSLDTIIAPLANYLDFTDCN